MFPEIVAAYQYYKRRKQGERLQLKQLSIGFALIGMDTMQYETFEPEETRVVLDKLKNTDVFVDVGANVGYYTCIALHNGIKSISIEPLNDNLNVLYKNIDVNGWNDVEVFPVALGKEPGIINLYGEGTGASLLAGWAGNPEAWKRLVPISTLDILLGTRFAEKRLLIKIDVEGAEFELLQGSLSTITMDPKPTWLIEISLTEYQPKGVHQEFLDIFELFWKNGYEAISLGKDDRIVTPEDVNRWVKNCSVDFGYVSYLFQEKQ